MQKSKLQNILFTLVMAFVMVYAMVCYNIALDKGGMSNEIFLIAFHEIPIMWPIACILEYFVVEKLATKLAFRIVTPKGSPGIYYDRDLLDDRLPDVPGDELYRDTAFYEPGKRNHRTVAAENRTEFSDGAVLADFLCRSGGTESVRAAE